MERDLSKHPSWHARRVQASERDLIPERDEFDDASVERAMRQVPSGAAALAGLTVALLLVFWFVVYLVVYLPRGLVG
jgi:Cytochrome c oxidase subunit IIa family